MAAEIKTLDREALVDQLAELAPDDRVDVVERAEATWNMTAPIDEVEAAADAKAHAPILKALLEESEDAWAADADQARVEVAGSCGLLWYGQGTLFFAPRGSGKTTLWPPLGSSMALAGTKVLYLDRENGGAALKEKLADTVAANPKWDAATIRENFWVKSWPEFDPAWTGDAYGAAIASMGFNVVVYDSMRELFDQFDLDDNSKRDWSKVWSKLGSPLIRRGIVPVFQDNTGHKNKTRAAGTAGKGDALQQGYRVRTPHRFTRETTGKLELHCTRSRLGHIGNRWVMTLGGGVYDLPTTDLEATAKTEADKVMATVTTEYQEVGDKGKGGLCKLLDMDRRTFMKIIEDINSDEEHDTDDEDYGEFVAPILIRGGGKTGKPTEVALRADDERLWE